MLSGIWCLINEQLLKHWVFIFKNRNAISKLEVDFPVLEEGPYYPDLLWSHVWALKQIGMPKLRNSLSLNTY